MEIKTEATLLLCWPRFFIYMAEQKRNFIVSQQREKKFAFFVVQGMDSKDAYQQIFPEKDFRQKNLEIYASAYIRKPGVLRAMEAEQAKIQETSLEQARDVGLTIAETLLGIKDLALNGKKEEVRLRAYEISARKWALLTDKVLMQQRAEIALKELSYSEPENIEKATSENPQVVSSFSPETPINKG